MVKKNCIMDFPERKFYVEEAVDSLTSKSADEDHVADTLDLTQIHPETPRETFIYTLTANCNRNQEVEAEEIGEQHSRLSIHKTLSTSSQRQNISSAPSSSPGIHENANAHGHRIKMGCRLTIGKLASLYRRIMQSANSAKVHAKAGATLKLLESGDIDPAAVSMSNMSSENTAVEKLGCNLGLPNSCSTDAFFDSTELNIPYVLLTYNPKQSSARLHGPQKSKSETLNSRRTSSCLRNPYHSRNCNIVRIAIVTPSFSKKGEGHDNIYNPVPLNSVVENRIHLANNNNIDNQNMIHHSDTGIGVERSEPKANRNDAPVEGFTSMDSGLNDCDFSAEVTKNLEKDA